MNLETPKHAFATREAHEALLELKRLIDDAADMTHTAELESFRVAISRNEHNSIRNSLRIVVERLKSADFDRAVYDVREKLERAVSVQ